MNFFSTAKQCEVEYQEITNILLALPNDYVHTFSRQPNRRRRLKWEELEENGNWEPTWLWKRGLWRSGTFRQIAERNRNEAEAERSPERERERVTVKEGE